MSNRSTPLTLSRTIPGLGLVGVATLFRLVLNTARRFAYPFAPALSRGLGVPLTAITSIIAINQSTAVLGMFFGPLADRLGYRLLMLAGLHMIYHFITEKDLLALLRTPPNEFQLDDTIALEKAVEETIRQSMDAIGLDANLLTPSETYSPRRRLV